MTTSKAAAPGDLNAALSRRGRGLLWCAVLSGVLLSMVDQTIVGTALPTMVKDLDGSGWYVWVVSANLVPATVMIPVFTRLPDRFGRQRMLLGGMAMFVGASAVCRRAPDDAIDHCPRRSGSRCRAPRSTRPAN